ncbi:hypothetical protein MPH_07454 [Macrophomina phaseolina MS6]|uniref:Uncharacterized protein n=1 Tax=Macrophomina phaseolina (strain MS6) TaxID=1126212 RepID=K2RL35_MACPH|nr:hypothetical protein MPH_07454 [Macrophomina phaseolina MS6]
MAYNPLMLQSPLIAHPLGASMNILLAHHAHPTNKQFSADHSPSRSFGLLRIANNLYCSRTLMLSLLSFNPRLTVDSFPVSNQLQTAHHSRRLTLHPTAHNNHREWGMTSLQHRDIRPHPWPVTTPQGSRMRPPTVHYLQRSWPHRPRSATPPGFNPSELPVNDLPVLNPAMATCRPDCNLAEGPPLSSTFLRGFSKPRQRTSRIQEPENSRTWPHPADCDLQEQAVRQRSHKAPSGLTVP